MVSSDLPTAQQAKITYCVEGLSRIEELAARRPARVWAGVSRSPSRGLTSQCAPTPRSQAQATYLHFC